MKNNLVDLNLFKAKKAKSKELARSRKPLMETHGQKPVSDEQNFSQRIQRIRSNIEQINNMITELKNATKPKK